MLRNERYIGVWRFKTMQWVKVPGTNRRLPRKRPASEAMVRHQPDLRIIDLPLWHAVQATIAKGSPMRGRRRPKSRYLLSGIITCKHCGAGLTICGLSPSYYRCPSRVRGLCSNGASLRTSPLLADVFDEIRFAIRKSPLLREAIDTQNASHGDVVHAQIDGRKHALADIEKQIERLVKFVADGGDRLDYVAETIGRLEADARLQKAEIEVLARLVKKPVAKVTVAHVDKVISELRNATPDDIDAARLRLRRWTADVPMRFDGMTLEIELDSAALVADVANAGAPLPSYPAGAKIALRMPVAYLIPRTKRRLVGIRPAGE